MKKDRQNLPTCNQCGKDMPYVIEVENKEIPVCLNPECPNFALLQIGQEMVAEFLNKEIS